MSRLRFDKVEGTGNDFIVVTASEATAVDWRVAAPRLCDRHHGIGADGVLLVGPGERADLSMRLFNADGTEAEMCGNGIRCTAKYALDHGLTHRRNVQWDTGAGLVHTDVMRIDGAEATVRVNMGKPRLQPAEIPVDAGEGEVMDLHLDLDGEPFMVACVGMGNPHAVTFVDSVDRFPLDRIGPLVERHRRFPNRTNFEVAEVVDAHHVRMRVWERGVGETQACGTGACAVAVASRLRRGTAADVEVALPGGVLGLHWEEGGTVLLTGLARTVYSGQVELPRAGFEGLAQPA